jgi:hypothetical protein
VNEGRAAVRDGVADDGVSVGHGCVSCRFIRAPWPIRWPAHRG